MTVECRGSWRSTALTWTWLQPSSKPPSNTASADRLPIEAARCLEGLAAVAEQRGVREQAMEYIDRAGELYSRHDAKLYLDRVLAKKEILRA